MNTQLREDIDSLLNQIITHDSNVADTFGQIVANKVAAALDTFKVDSANSLFNGSPVKESKD